MAFEVVVLGSNGTFPTSEGGTTGFLLRAGGTDIWMDAGWGTFMNLQRHTDYFDVRAVLLSHLHLDHFLDLYAFYYALRYSNRSPDEPTGIEVYAPGNTEEHLSKLLSDKDDEGHVGGFDGYLVFNRVRSGDSIRIDPFNILFGKTKHPTETLATRVEVDGRALTYTADTALCPEVITLAKGSQVLIAEASMQEAIENLSEVHMSARDAGEMAAKAEVERLVLTHISPGLDPQISVAQAEEKFDGEVLVAEADMKLTI